LGGWWAPAAHDQDTAAAWAPQTTLRVAADAVWQHGRAADCHAAAGHAGPLRAADLIEALAALPAVQPHWAAASAPPAADRV
jgi:hypothetical protein